MFIISELLYSVTFYQKSQCHLCQMFTNLLESYLLSMFACLFEYQVIHKCFQCPSSSKSLKKCQVIHNNSFLRLSLSRSTESMCCLIHASSRLLKHLCLLFTFIHYGILLSEGKICHRNFKFYRAFPLNTNFYEAITQKFILQDLGMYIDFILLIDPSIVLS